jgi:extracellular elastinolytic metalloproteinase
MKDDKVVSFANSFIDTSSSSFASRIAASTPTYDLNKAISNAEDALSGTKNDIEPGLEYLVRPDGSVALSHVLQVSNKEDGTWYEAFVDAHSGELLSVTDFVAEATVRFFCSILL